ncbi:preprotein translocase subunit SecA [Massilicoli timonensis]|uniref:preprotein translocase subunit SecA n=1 Tax=Massilicoli timonensis TaxID=2015901 RepID=UPI000C84CC14|nr:preprotein translocase subunit SecA [Massilicoli timonensis]
MGIMNALFSGDKKRLKQLEKKANEINALASQMEALSDAALKEKTDEFKRRYQEGETLDDLLVEAYAVAREASRRVIGEYPYLVQIMGAVAMHGGDIAEMKTGEGKTLTSVMCVYLNALTQKGVHVVTVNEYLAERDATWMGQIYSFLGLSVGFNKREFSARQKREAYACDITYTTNSELGFDYLRDNMVTDVKDRVMRGLHVAIVDEVDSILIDESRTPLIISGGAKKTANLYIQADQFAKRLKKSDYEIDEKTRQVMLSEDGVRTAERYFKVKNLYDVEHTQLVHHISQAMKANYIMMKDVEYVVADDEIVIVDQFTGRLMKGRAYSDGLHQAIEAKEGVRIKEETSTLATITYQNFFRLYEKLCGMTGTAKTEEEEFLSIYNMRVIEIPTNRPIARIDYPDAIYATPQLKFNALVEEVAKLYDRGQPVLVGTISVEVSELVSSMLQKRRIKHEVLNAKNHAREAEIIAKAGQVKAVTIATNMAGRGTDIKLSEESRALGGLAVLGSERHESRRIDNQLRGRSGRQGDPGYSRFYVSVRDQLMVRFGGDKLETLFKTLGDQQIESKLVTKSITQAQRRVEGYNFDVRKQLLEYDDVLRQQREIMYDQRNFVLENDDVHGIVHDMMDRVLQNVVQANTLQSNHSTQVQTDSLMQGLEVLGFDAHLISADELNGKEAEEAAAYLSEKAWNQYNEKIADIKEQFLPFEKNIVLRNMDRNWIEHIDMMSKLRDGIHLRSYAQDNPLQAYVNEGYEMFEEMMQRIAREVVFFTLKIQIERKEA